MAALQAGDDGAWTLGTMLQQLCVLIRSAGARAVLRRLSLMSADLDAMRGPADSWRRQLLSALCESASPQPSSVSMQPCRGSKLCDQF
eukprot:10858479-Karenia_brevis.AAC.1